jgi:hypothetical protein
VQDGQLESDEAFRQRLKAVVPLFTGGGTKQAVIGAVRSALGLPFDLAQLQLPPGFEALRRDIEQLIFIQEFSPTGERVIGRDLAVVNGAHEIVLAIDIPSVGGERPTIRWKMLLGGARGLEIIVQPDDPTLPTTGLRAAETLIIPAGETLVLTALNGGVLSAVVGFQELATQVTNLDGTIPALLPEVPIGRSEWTFRAQSGVFDVSPLDDFTTFDLPTFEIELSWLRYEPLTFDVHVPYFVRKAVDELKALHQYAGRLFVFEGLPFEALVAVVDQTRAAGVRGSVQFSLNFLDVHDQREQVHIDGLHSLVEYADVREDLTVSSINDVSEWQEMQDTLVIGGAFDISPFDRAHGFLD